MEKDDSPPSPKPPPVADGYATTVPPLQRMHPDDYAYLVTVDYDHYTDRAILTHGGMGRIVSARDRRMGRAVAIKEVLADNAGLRARFEREMLLTARLQHPSIVSVYEAGRWPSGEPFYAMKLVPGRSLDQVVALAKSLDERLALLPHVIAIADALAYAHEQRVIHRDLKPQNVMIGEFGETVVIDWGLAKDLADAGAGADSDLGPERKTMPSAETVVGSVLGTPAFMPPEQAEGVAVDARADVYAIGAILYYVLSGSPPYEGPTIQDLLSAVRAGPPVPLRLRDRGIPPDLLAIVDRAIARSPEARYTTARDLAEDLRRFQAGQLVQARRYSRTERVARYLTRHRTPVTIAAVAAALLAFVLGVSVSQIVREKQAAERSRAEAEGLLDVMLVELRNELAPIGRVDLLAAVAEKADAYYRLRPESEDVDDLLKRAVAFSNLGDVSVASGDSSKALEQLRESLRLYGTIAAKDQTPRDLGRIHAKIGAVVLAQGDTKGALDSFRAALAVDEEMAKKHPDDLQVVRDVLNSHHSIGRTLMHQGDPSAALVEFQRGHALAGSLVAKDGTNPVWLRQLAMSHDHLGRALEAQGKITEAMEHYRADLAIAESLAAKDPDDVGRQRDLSVSLSRIGTLLSKERKDYDGALVALRADLAITQRLAARDPYNLPWQRDLAASHILLGDVLALKKDPASALPEYRAALAIAEVLVARDPANAEWQRDLSVGYYKLGEVLLTDGKRAEASKELTRALEIAERLLALEPTNPDRQGDVDFLRQRIAACCR